MAEEKEQAIELETAFCEIEDIITKLESNDVSLKDSIELYQKGAKMIAQCKEELSGIEKEMLVIGENIQPGEMIPE